MMQTKRWRKHGRAEDHANDGKGNRNEEGMIASEERRMAVQAAAPVSSSTKGGRRYPSPVVKQDLARLGKDAESRRAALTSLRAVVEEHLDGSMMTRFLQQVGDSPEGRRHAPAIATDLARSHGHLLVPHIGRVVLILTHTLLASAASPSLQLDTAAAVAAIAAHCSSSSHTAEDVLRRLSSPFIDLLSDKVAILSTGAAACLRALVESEQWKFAPASLVSQVCLKAAMALATKSTQTVPHMSLLRSLASANASALALYDQPLLHLLLSDILPSPSWHLRRAAILLLESLLQAADASTIASHLQTCMAALSKRRHDQMPIVRKAVLQALRTAQALSHQEEIKRRMASHPGHTEDLSPQRHVHAHATNPEPFLRPAAPHAPVLIGEDQEEGAAFLDFSSPLSSSRDLHRKLQIPSDHLSPGPRADDADYFCGYYYDTNDRVSCRKVVHHIHDTRSSGAPAKPSPSPPVSPAKGPLRHIPVPPLPLSSVVQNQASLSKSPPSTLREVKVLRSNEDLLASCERSILTDGTRERESRRNHYDNVTVSPFQDQALLNVDFGHLLSQARTSQTSAEKQMIAIDDFQAICDKLLELKEEDGPTELPQERQRVEGDSQRVLQSNQEQENSVDAAAAISSSHYGDGVEADCLPPLTTVHNQGALKIGDGAVPLTDIAQGDNQMMMMMMMMREAHGEGVDTEAETSSGEWSVRDNPIADDEQQTGCLMSKHRDTPEPLTALDSILEEQLVHQEDMGRSCTNRIVDIPVWQQDGPLQRMEWWGEESKDGDKCEETPWEEDCIDEAVEMTAEAARHDSIGEETRDQADQANIDCGKGMCFPSSDQARPSPALRRIITLAGILIPLAFTVSKLHPAVEMYSASGHYLPPT